MKLNRRFLVLAMAALPLVAHAQTSSAPAKIALLSFIGEELGLVSYQHAIGSRLDQNRKASTTVADAGFDATALGAMRDQVQEAGGGGKYEPLLYAIKSQKYAADPSLLITSGRATLPQGFVDAMKKDGVTHVLLLTRRRADAQMQAMKETVGGGRVEGVGYYAEHVSEVVHSRTGFQSRGFLSPYVSLLLSLIRLDGQEVLAQRPVFESQVIADDGSFEAGTPWRLVPDTQKIPHLKGMIEESLKTAVPAILAKVS